jgi:hypothetical protein
VSAPDHPPLRDFQTWMQTFIVSPGTPEQALEAAETAAGFEDGSVRRLVKPSATLSEMERLQIYRRMYPLRMREALAIDFPVSRALLGPKLFARLVDEYVQTHPSTSWTLDHLGRHMVPFVGQHSLGESFPGLRDLVALEQAVCEVFHELDAPVLAPHDLTNVPPEAWPEVRLQCVPALRLLNLNSNANELCKAHSQGQELPEYRPGPSYVVVWRHQYQTWRRPLEPAAHALLGRLREGAPLGEALEECLRVELEEEGAEGQLFEWFNSWVSEGFFQALQLTPRPTAPRVHPA